MPEHLAEYLEHAALRFPQHPAAVGPSGASISYSTLNDRADALAAHLAEHAIGQGSRVAIVLPKGIPALIAFFGVLKAGAAYVPIDFHGPPDRTNQILTDCQVTAVIGDSRFGATAASEADDEGSYATIRIGDATGTPFAMGSPFRDVVASGRKPSGVTRQATDLAYIIYTSGSTGVPKGVMIAHTNAVSFVDWCSSVLSPEPSDQISSHTPFHFDASVQDIYPAIKHGATLHLISEGLAKSAKDLATFIAARKLTFWTSTPSALLMLMQFGNIQAQDCSALRVVAFGGEVFPIKHLRTLRRLWPEPVFYNVYGPTETTTTCVFAQLPQEIPAERQLPYPIGFPCAHCEAIALTGEGTIANAGEEGVLLIKGPSIFSGYWNRPRETQAAFIERDGTRWYNTGDVVRWDPAEGYTYVRRQDRMVKRRGYRIELDEIERALYLHPDADGVAVIADSDDDSSTRIIAYVSSPRRDLSVIELKTFSASRLPAYMIPDRFIVRETLPTTSTGKVDYRMLSTQLRQDSVA